MRISDWSSDVCSSDLVALTDRSAPCNAALQFGLFDQIAILMRQHVALHLSDRIDGHVDDDEQAGAAELKRQTGPGDAIFGYDADQRQLRSSSEEHTSDLQSLMRTSSAVFSLKTHTHPTNPP